MKSLDTIHDFCSEITMSDTFWVLTSIGLSVAENKEEGGVVSFSSGNPLATKLHSQF